MRNRAVKTLSYMKVFCTDENSTIYSTNSKGFTTKRAECAAHVLMRSAEASAGRKTVRGFTLIEVLITLAVLSIIATLGLFATHDLYRGTSVQEERDTLVSLLTRARSHSMTNLSALPHGLCCDDTSESYIVFRGTYALSAVEETAPKGKSVTLSGLPACGSGDEIFFTQLSGKAAPTSITISQDGNTSTIDVNEQGTILW